MNPSQTLEEQVKELRAEMNVALAGLSKLINHVKQIELEVKLLRAAYLLDTLSTFPSKKDSEEEEEGGIARLS